PVKGVDRAIGRGRGDHGWRFFDQIVQEGHGNVHDGRSQRAIGSKQHFEGLHTPDRDHGGQDDEGRPGFEDAACGQCCGGLFGSLVLGGRTLLCLKAEDALGLPYFQEQGQHHQGNQGRGNVRQFGANIVRGQELNQGEGTTPDQNCRPGFLDTAPAVHDGHQPEQHEDGHEGQLATGHLADFKGINTRYLTGHNDRNTHGTESNRRRVCNQAQTGSVQGTETQTSQQGSGNCDGCAKTGRPFQEGTKAETNQNQLQALVRRDGQDRGANNVELTCLDRDLVQKNGRHNDPGNGPQTIEKAIYHRGQRRGNWHAIEEQGNAQSQQHRNRASQIALHAQLGQGQEKKDDR